MFYLLTLFLFLILSSSSYPPTAVWKTSPFSYSMGVDQPQYTALDIEGGSVYMYSVILDSANTTVTLKRWSTAGTPTLLVS